MQSCPPNFGVHSHFWKSFKNKKYVPLRFVEVAHTRVSKDAAHRRLTDQNSGAVTSDARNFQVRPSRITSLEVQPPCTCWARHGQQTGGDFQRERDRTLLLCRVFLHLCLRDWVAGYNSEERQGTHE